MKLSKYCKYQVPLVGQTSLEVEGIVCHSVVFNTEVIELDNMNSAVPESQRLTEDDPYFLDF